MPDEVKEYPVVWFQGAGCSGCSVSLLNALSPSVAHILLEQLVPGKHINLRFHPTIMAASGEPAISEIRAVEEDFADQFLLVLEGPVQEKAYCAVGAEGGKELYMADVFRTFAQKALAIIAIGGCAAFGGIPAGAPNPTGALGAGDFLRKHGIQKPCINIPGCPAHPDWFSGTVASVLLFGLPHASQLDDLGRPKRYFGALIHDNCPRRGFFDGGRFAKHYGDEGCLLELGCKGPQTYADCPIRLWNSGTNWCVGAGAPCIGCVEPEFPDRNAPLYEKVLQERFGQFSVKARQEV